MLKIVIDSNLQTFHISSIVKATYLSVYNMITRKILCEAEILRYGGLFLYYPDQTDKSNKKRKNESLFESFAKRTLASFSLIW